MKSHCHVTHDTHMTTSPRVLSVLGWVRWWAGTSTPRITCIRLHTVDVIQSRNKYAIALHSERTCDVQVALKFLIRYQRLTRFEVDSLTSVSCREKTRLAFSSLFRESLLQSKVKAVPVCEALKSLGDISKQHGQGGVPDRRPYLPALPEASWRPPPPFEPSRPRAWLSRFLPSVRLLPPAGARPPSGLSTFSSSDPLTRGRKYTAT